MIWYNDFKKLFNKKQTYGLKLKISKTSLKFHKNTKKFPTREKNQNKVKQIKPKLKKQITDLTSGSSCGMKSSLRGFKNL